MIQNTCFHTSNLISLTNFENNLYEFLKHINNNNNNASNSSFFENNNSNTSSNRKMVQRRHGLLCKILMDVLKPSEWVVNEDNNNNDENLYTFSNHDDDQDNDTFETNSVKILYSLPVNAFTLIADEEDNVFIAKILNYEEQIISENSNQFNAIINETSAQNRNSLLKSYDYLLNDKYEVIVNEKTLNRVKNYFR